MRWLITGGTGFVGSNLVSRLREDRNNSHEIVVFDNLSGSTLENFQATANIGTARLASVAEPLWDRADGTVKLVVGDIRDARLVTQVIAGADIVVHLAANTGVQPSVVDPRLDCETNILGTLNCLEAARAAGVKRFVFASSGAPIGLTEPPITEKSAPRPASPYGASKLAGEGYCCAYSSSFGLPTVALRFSNVYGPYSWRKGSVIAKFIKTAMAGNDLVVNGDGTQTRDFIYINDLIDAIVRASTTEDLNGELFQISTGVETRIVDLLELLVTELVKAGMPRPSMRFGEMGPGDVMRNYADPSKALSVLGWSPKCDLATGLGNTVRWFSGLRANG
jgi:UDP-glucose 4-epimerase